MIIARIIIIIIIIIITIIIIIIMLIISQQSLCEDKYAGITSAELISVANMKEPN